MFQTTTQFWNRTVSGTECPDRVTAPNVFPKRLHLKLIPLGLTNLQLQGNSGCGWWLSLENCEVHVGPWGMDQKKKVETTKQW